MFRAGSLRDVAKNALFEPRLFLPIAALAAPLCPPRLRHTNAQRPSTAADSVTDYNRLRPDSVAVTRYTPPPSSDDTTPAHCFVWVYEPEAAVPRRRLLQSKSDDPLSPDLYKQPFTGPCVVGLDLLSVATRVVQSFMESRRASTPMNPILGDPLLQHVDASCVMFSRVLLPHQRSLLPRHRGWARADVLMEFRLNFYSADNRVFCGLQRNAAASSGFELVPVCIPEAGQDIAGAHVVLPEHLHDEALACVLQASAWLPA